MIDPDELEKFKSETKEKHGLKSLEMYHNKLTGHLRLDSIQVHKDKQGQGIGTAAMKDITAFADKYKQPMSLHTAQRDPHHGTTSSSRLKKFYKQHGFVENKGRNKDFTVSDNMIRKTTIKEDAPVNSAGGGKIASIGVGLKGEPPASKSMILRRGKFAGNDTFVVHPKTFHKARLSKQDRSWWKKYIDEEDGIDEIRHFANRNPDKPVILQDASTGAMVYARYGKK